MKRYLSIILLLTIAGCATDEPSFSKIIKAKAFGRDTKMAREKNGLAVMFMQSKHYDQAYLELKTAINADPMYGPAHNNLGKIYYHQDKFYEAAQEFQYAAKLMPNKPQPHNNLGLVFETTASTLTGPAATQKLNQAIQTYEKAVKLDPNNPQYIGNLARARIRQDLKDKKTRQLLEKLIKIDPRPKWQKWAKTTLKLMPNETK